MLKKIFILFLSANLCAAEDIKKPELSGSNNSSMKVIGLGLASVVAYTIMPDLFGDTSHITKIAGAAVGAYGVYTLGGMISESINQSEDKKVRAGEAHKRCKIFTAEQEFRSCLMDNAYKPRNASGIPTVCEHLAHVYGTTAGTCALDEMTTLFKNTYEN